MGMTWIDSFSCLVVYSFMQWKRLSCLDHDVCVVNREGEEMN